MGRSPTYNTRQGHEILSYIASLGGSFVTVEQIANYFQENQISIGLTTIYRNLDKLLAGGKIRKYNIDGISGASYQYVYGMDEQCNHIHFKCEDCGDMIQLNCKKFDELGNHVEDEHEFRINPIKTVFYGTCKKCTSARCKSGL